MRSRARTNAARPPHLASIAPLSVIDDTIKGTLAPGGVLNSGFAVSWAKDRQHDAQPAPGGGQSWATDRIKAGDNKHLVILPLKQMSESVNVTQDQRLAASSRPSLGMALTREQIESLSDEELDRLARLIDQARSSGE